MVQLIQGRFIQPIDYKISEVFQAIRKNAGSQTRKKVNQFSLRKQNFKKQHSHNYQILKQLGFSRNSRNGIASFAAILIESPRREGSIL